MPQEETPDLSETPSEKSHESTASAKGPAPRAATGGEVAYLRKLIEDAVPVVVKIRGGEEVGGVIEYYDTSFIRITRDGLPNLFIFKKDILYLREDGPGKPVASEAAAE